MAQSNLDTLLKKSGGDQPAGAVVTRARPWQARLARLLPVGLVAGFVILLVILLGDRLAPSRELPMASVVTVRDSGGAPAAGLTTADPHQAPMLFQASGWIEPDPLPIKATALYSGVVEEVKVLEGEAVTKGQVLAILIDDDAKLKLTSAEARLASLVAQSKAHQGLIEMGRAKIATLEKQLLAEEAKRNELNDLVERFEEVQAGGVSEREIVQARLQVLTREAEIEAKAATDAELQAELTRHVEMHKDFDARIAEAEAEVATRQLDLDRTRIPSPVDGIVLRLLAVPGQKLMLEMDDPDSATVAVVYQPDQLQARIDVPLEEAAQLAVGQAVRIRSNFLSDRVFHGTVTRIVGEADLQRNTLQAKVRIVDPDPRLRPEMLCRAEFLAAASARAAEEGESTATAGFPGRVRLFVSEDTLTNRSVDAAEVWTLDASGKRLAKRKVALGAAVKDGHREVVDGLKPGDRVVLDPPGDLEPGQRARPGE